MKLNIFSKKQPVAQPETKRTKKRSFKAAIPTRFTAWLNSTFSPINRDLKNDLVSLIEKSRDLAKNNEIFRSYLDTLDKSIIGNQRF